MTPEEQADSLGDVFESSGADAAVEVWRSEIAAAIREAVAEERERCAKVAEDEALRMFNDREEVNQRSCLLAARAVAKAIREAT